METKTVKELRDLAKNRGFRRYSGLRKAELIRILRGSILDDKIQEINVPVLRPTTVSAVYNINNVVRQSTEAVINWAEWLQNAGREVVRKVSPRLKDLKEKVDALFKYQKEFKI